MLEEAEEDFPEPELWCEEFCGDAEFHHKDCPVAKKARGTWCTPKWLADLIGTVTLDPCSNPRSRIRSVMACTLEKGDNGLHDLSTPGSLRWQGQMAKAVQGDTVFVNPPYGSGEVVKWVRHYAHTRYIFLLRWDPSTDWFSELITSTDMVWFPNQRLNFEPPPRIKSSSNAYPHALYMRDPGSDLKSRLGTAGYLFSLDGARGKSQSVGNGRPERDDRENGASSRAGGPPWTPPASDWPDFSKLRKAPGTSWSWADAYKKLDAPPGTYCINRGPHNFACCKQCDRPTF